MQRSSIHKYSQWPSAKMNITQDVRLRAKHGIAKETAALLQGFREKAEEFQGERRRDLTLA